MKTIRTLVCISLSVLGLAGILASGGGGDDSTPPAAPIGDISGTWTINDTVTAATGVCADEIGISDSFQISVTQDGNSITVVTSGITFNGTLNGSKVQWTGSYPEDGGTATLNSMDVTIAADCNSLSGTTSWSWSGFGESCSGSSAVTGTRNSPVGCGSTAPVAPTASFTASATSGSAPLTVNFDASASSDSDGSIASYGWSFGDGASATGATTSHTYAADGVYTVTLTVTDNDGATDTHTATITVGDGGTGSGGNEIDEEEPNDTPDTAQVIASIPVTVNGATFGNTSVDFDPDTFDPDIFSYTPATATTVTVTLSGYGANDLDLYVFDSTLAEVDSSFTTESTETVSVPLQAGETYYFLVEPWEVTGTTSYSLAFE